MENQFGYFSRKLRAGKRRTYFFDVRSTKQGDYFVTITESKKRFDKSGYDSHKIFLYKEDFQKFLEALNETIDHIKTELNPDFDYDAYDREVYQASIENQQRQSEENPEEFGVKEPKKEENASLSKENATDKTPNFDEELAKKENNNDAMEW